MPEEKYQNDLKAGQLIDGGKYAEPFARLYPFLYDTPSGTTGQKTPAAADTGQYPGVQSETGQMSETGKDLYEGAKTVLPDVGAGAVVAGGKMIRDGAWLAGWVTGSEGVKQFADPIEKSTDQFMKTGGSDTLNRQRDAINQTLSDKNASGADMAGAIGENPYGALSGAGTELAGIAIPGKIARLARQGIRPGAKIVPKITEYGTRLLPYVPHAVQSIQGVKKVGDKVGEKREPVP